MEIGGINWKVWGPLGSFRLEKFFFGPKSKNINEVTTYVVAKVKLSNIVKPSKFKLISAPQSSRFYDCHKYIEIT